jgi:hypothetical protein
MTVSSTYSPVPSCLAVDAQPTTAVSIRATKKAENSLESLELDSVMAILLRFELRFELAFSG